MGPADPILITCAHGRMLREPKGGPDVALAGGEEQSETLVRAANTLSVQGWMARIVLLHVSSMDQLPGQERDALLGNVPFVSILGDGAASAGELARAALEAIRS